MRGLAFAAGLVSAAVAVPPASAADPDRQELKAGVFLYAAPGLEDPNFAKTVVFLIEHGRDGSLGLVIDRPSEVPVTEVLGKGSGTEGLVVYWGGPVEPETVLGLIRTSSPGETMARVLDGVYLTGSRPDLAAVARGKRAEERVRIYRGYAGWGRGQLEAEREAGGWLIAPANATAIFSTDPEGVWERARQLRKRLEARTSPGTREPVLLEDRIGGHHPQLLLDRLGDQQPVERIPMMERHYRDPRGVPKVNGQRLETVGRDLLGKEPVESALDPERAQAHLDGDLPGTGHAQEALVAAARNRRPGFPGELGSPVHPPEEGVGIEEQPHPV